MNRTLYGSYSLAHLAEMAIGRSNHENLWRQRYKQLNNESVSCWSAQAPLISQFMAELDIELMAKFLKLIAQFSFEFFSKVQIDMENT